MPTTKRKDSLVWIDCEMTGLDPGRDRLLEIATIVTNYDLKIIAVGPDLVIHQSDERLEAMDAWNRRTHKKSGLIDRVRDSDVSTAEAERQTLAFVKKHCYARTAPLCGNSVHHDKEFLIRYMPELVAYLHYRIIDVSTVKLLTRGWYGEKYKVPEKPEVHRALYDIEQSIAELAFYREKVFVKA